MRVDIAHDGYAPNCATALTAGRLSALLARVAYKNWYARVGSDGVACWLQFCFHGYDMPQIWRSRKWRISEHMTDGEIVQTALLAVLTAEEHEAREQFLVDGVAAFGPHQRLDALLAAARTGPEVRS